MHELHDDGYRHENKYFMSINEAAMLRRRLCDIMKRDPNSDGTRRYIISSLYFDDMDDRSLAASNIGYPYRKKYRIRIYNHDDSFISLEKKEKKIDLSKKTTLRISRADYDDILMSHFEVLKKYNDPLADEFYYDTKHAGYRPKTVVEYTREVYTYPISNVRITFDTDIKSSTCSADLFSSTGLVPVMPWFAVLLEVKFDHVLPEFISDLLPQNVMNRVSNCKYALGRTYI